MATFYGKFSQRLAVFCASVGAAWLMASASLATPKPPQHQMQQASDTAAAALVGRLSAMQSMTGDFTQTLKDDQGEVIETMTGTFAIKKPGYFRWETQPPFEQLIVSDPKTLWVHNPDLEQVTVYSNDDSQLSPAKILSSDFSELVKEYTVESRTSKNADRFVLKQKNQSQAQFESLVFVFQKDRLASIELYDGLKQQTLIAFADTQINTAISNGLFEFTPPPNTDVIVNE